MKAKSMMLIVIALVCGLVASIGVSQVMSRGDGAIKVQERDVLVAMSAIDIGARLTADNVKLEKWPADRIPEGAITDIEKVEGKFARGRFVAGEMVLEGRIGESPHIPIPPGYRVVPIKVQRDFVSDLVKPGDKVDISLYYKQRGGARNSSEERVKTILTNVRIYSINAETERNPEDDNSAKAVKSMTVMVTHQQAEKITLAQEVGKLSLLLRSHEDSSEIVDQDGINMRQLLGDAPQSATEVTEQSADDGGFMNFLSQQNNLGAAAAMPLAAAPVHKMVMFTPEGVMQYEWSDASELPKQVPVNGALPQLPAPNGAKAGVPPGMPDLSALQGLDGLNGLEALEGLNGGSKQPGKSGIGGSNGSDGSIDLNALPLGDSGLFAPGSN